MDLDKYCVNVVLLSWPLLYVNWQSLPSDPPF
jgi:hypothetical protein